MSLLQSDGFSFLLQVDSAIHVGQIIAGVRVSGRRLAQCNCLEIKTKRTLPMQVDGEPWMQAPCTVSTKLLVCFILPNDAQLLFNHCR